MKCLATIIFACLLSLAVTDHCFTNMSLQKLHQAQRTQETVLTFIERTQNLSLIQARDNSELFASLKRTNQVNAGLKQALAQATGVVEQNGLRMRDLTDENTELREGIDYLKNRLQNVNDDLKKANEELQNAHLELEKTKEELEKTKEELEKTKEALEAKNAK